MVEESRRPCRERASVGPITRRRPTPKIKHLHEVRVGREQLDQSWLWEEAGRIAGQSGYKKRSPFWAFTIVAFDTKQKADAFEALVQRRRREEELRQLRQRPCPVRIAYEEAARRQHAVIWGLSTGVIGEVVRTYRRERRNCSTHGHPNWIASDAILAVAPSISRERAREMVDAMLAWTISRYATWFWTGLQGERIINRY
jgi:hypothetical protein